MKDLGAVSVRDVVRSYGKTEALKGVSFDVGKGELFGIIGPDGAGKTTLFRILTTLLVPDAGSATVSGYDTVRDYVQIRRSVGYMPGKFALYQDLTVEENLSFFASVFGSSIGENYHLVEDIYRQIEPFKDRKAGKLSGGMKQKLALCCAMIHKPEVLFLDEPTTGVDPVSRKEFWQMLGRLKAQGITIVVSTPYMDEASLCDRIALIKDGRFLTVDTPENIVAGYEKVLFSVSLSSSGTGEVFSSGRSIGTGTARGDGVAVNAGAAGYGRTKIIDDIRGIKGVESCHTFGSALHVTMAKGSDAERLSAGLAQAGYEGVRIERIAPGIEDCFMELDRNE